MVLASKVLWIAGIAGGAAALSATMTPTTTPRRVVLFDVMDTLVRDPFFMGMHEDVFGFESLEALYAESDLEAYEAFETGAIGEAELWRRYYRAGSARPAPDGARAVAYLKDRYEYVAHMRSMLGELKRIGDVEVYAFSNYGPYWKLIEEKLELSRYLDWKFVSCETGLRKPDPRAFRDVIDTLGVDLASDTVVFVDDSATNCEAARSLGIDAIRFDGDSAVCRTALIGLGFTELRV